MENKILFIFGVLVGGIAGKQWLLTFKSLETKKQIYITFVYVCKFEHFSLLWCLRIVPLFLLVTCPNGLVLFVSVSESLTCYSCTWNTLAADNNCKTVLSGTTATITNVPSTTTECTYCKVKSTYICMYIYVEVELLFM